jgi:hypothetical protein
MVGDRHPQLNIIYPADAFFHNGGRIIDITKAPFNARGDGSTDDTHAFIQALDTIAQRLRLFDWQSDSSTNLTIYLPKGTYLVSNTLTYSGPKITFPGYTWGGMIRLRLVGQQRDSTIIRLKPASPGFSADTLKTLLAFQKTGDPKGNNIPASNQLRNLTIAIGPANPRAVGVLFLGANKCDINNVAIRAEAGSGAIGLDLPLISTQGHLQDITIDGFDTAVRVVPYGETNPTFEHLSLINQRHCGIEIGGSNPVFRSVFFDAPVGFCRINANTASVVLIDALLQGRGTTEPAIHLADHRAQLFARSLNVAGFGATVRRDSTTLMSGSIQEYLSAPLTRLFTNAATSSLNLPIQDAPPPYWEQDRSQWANVDSFPGADGKSRIQNALNSGKSTIYFPALNYPFSGTVSIPASVRHIDFMFARFNAGAQFSIDESSDTPLHLQNHDGRGTIIQTAPRTVVLRQLSMRYRATHSAPSRLFIESCANIGSDEDFCPPNLSIWARGINNEIKNSANFKVYGGSLWVLGFKSEGPQMAFHVTNNGRCEVLGGYRNETMSDSGYPLLYNDNAQVSLVGFSSMSRVYKVVLWERRGDTLAVATMDSFPPRGNDYFVPLYVGYPQGGSPLQPPPVVHQVVPKAALVNAARYNLVGQLLTPTAPASAAAGLYLQRGPEGAVNRAVVLQKGR